MWFLAVKRWEDSSEFLLRSGFHQLQWWLEDFTLSYQVYLITAFFKAILELRFIYTYIYEYDSILIWGVFFFNFYLVL